MCERRMCELYDKILFVDVDQVLAPHGNFVYVISETRLFDVLLPDLYIDCLA